MFTSKTQVHIALGIMAAGCLGLVLIAMPAAILGYALVAKVSAVVSVGVVAFGIIGSNMINTRDM